MTMPNMTNCAHNSEGLCLACVEVVRKATYLAAIEDAATECERRQTTPGNTHEDFHDGVCNAAIAIRALGDK
jgi:hypothetical protein